MAGPTGSEEDALKARFQALDDSLSAEEKARHPEYQALTQRLARIYRARFTAWRDSLRKDDPELALKRAGVSADIAELDAELDPAHRTAHMREAARQRQREQELRRVETERRGVAASLKHVPWMSARPPADPLAPNGCATCANSSVRLSRAATPSQPISAGQARDAIANRYPKYVKRGPMTTVSLSPTELDRTCGKNAAACAPMGANTVYLPRNPSPDVVAHETMHALTSPAWGDRVPETVNESMTEFMTRRMGYFAEGGGVRTKAYEGGQPLLDRYIRANPAREDALAPAYFTGDFSALEALEDAPPPGKTRAMMLDQRLASWDLLMANRLPGSSLTIDDEAIVARQAAPRPH